MKDFARSLILSYLNLHTHRYFRRLFCTIIIAHILIILFPLASISITIPSFLNSFLIFSHNIWPFPTFKFSTIVTDSTQVLLANVVLKAFEISIIMLYFVDLLPKIFIWRKPFWWKLLNIIVVAIMVIQAPLSMRGFMEAGVSFSKLRVRICSISLSFLLVCEILSLRERAYSEFQAESYTSPKNKLRGKTAKRVPLKEHELQSYTWEDVVEHDKPHDCWVVLHGKVYDLTEWVPIHPGGDIIYDGAGGDCTSYWESYHPTSTVKKGPPKEYIIGYLRDYEPFYSWDGDFYKTVKERVEKKIPRDQRRYDIRMYIKFVIVLLSFFVSLYYYIKINNMWMAVIFGLASSQIGVNIMHDGNHVAFSTSKTWNKIAGACLELIGSSSIIYKRSHDFGHHGCVNHLELDRAFDTMFPWFRIHSALPRLKVHAFQHIYMFFIYGLANFGDFIGQFDELNWFSNYPVRRGYISMKAKYMRCFVLVYWFIYALFLPAYLHGYVHAFQVWWVFNSVFGLGYALLFAVNHWTEEAGFVDYSSISSSNWGKLQVENSSNFAIKSTFWNIISGGLNFQIEHHLFPGFIHTRYPEIQEIVKEACKEYGLRYYEYPTFFSALSAHYRFLKKLGEEDKPTFEFSVIEPEADSDKKDK